MAVNKDVLYLSKQDVMGLGITMAEVVDTLDDVFREKSAGRYEMPAKIGIHTRPDDFLHAMPCWAEKWNAAGIKWVSGYKNNPKDYGLDYINGLLILNDTTTGIPIAIMDSAWITAIRTGGVSGLSAKYLAKKDSSTLAIIASGAQARTALQAFKVTVPNLKKVWVWDVFPASAERYVKEMGEMFPDLDMQATTCVEEAVRDADIIGTHAPVVKEDIGVIDKAWLKPGVLAASVDNDVLWKMGSIPGTFQKYFTDDQSQYLHFRDHIGSIKQIPGLPEELGDMISGKVPGRENDSENIYANNIGIAFDDIAVAAVVYQRAKEKGVGIVLPQ